MLTLQLKTAVLGIVVVAALSTAGCGLKVLPIDSFESPIAIQPGSDSLRIAVCVDVEVTKLWATERNVGDGSDWEYFLRADGSAFLKSGDGFDVENMPLGLTATQNSEPMMNTGFQIEVVILSETGDGKSLRAMFSVPDGAVLVNDIWLQSDGTITDVPCPAGQTPVPALDDVPNG